MVSSQFIDENFDINNCIKYNLSIQFALDGFSFSVFDIENNKFLVQKSIDLLAASIFDLKNLIEEIFLNEEILKQDFNKCNIAYLQRDVLLVPSRIFNYSDFIQLYDHAFTRRKDDELLIDEQLFFGVSIVGTIPSMIKKLFNEKYKCPTFFNLATIVANYITKNQQLALVFTIFKYKHNLMIIVSEKGVIKTLTNFYAKNDEDSIFYIFNLIKQLDLPKETIFTLLGDIASNSLIVKTLKKYYINIQFPSFSKNYAVSYTILKNPDHNFIPLFELALCE